MKMKKLLALILALLLMTALFAGCGEPAETQPEGSSAAAPETSQPARSEPTSVSEPVEEVKGTLKIGHLLDLTGTEAAAGTQSQTAFNYALKALGLFGGYELEVIEGDCQSNAATAADLAKKMVEEDGVIAIFGPTQIGHKSSVAGYLAESGVPLILYNGTPIGVTKKTPWAIGDGGSTMQMPTVMADYAYNELGYRTVYTMAQDTTGGRNYIDPFVENFTAMGGNVVGQTWIPMGTSELGPYFAMLADDCDAIVAWTSSADAIALWKEWFNSGTYETTPIVATMHGGFTDFFIFKALENANPAIVDAVLKGTYAPIMYSYTVDTPENNEFVEGWKAEFGAVPFGNNFPGACYQALQVLQKALESNGGDSAPEALLEAILKVNFVGPEGHVSFADGQQCATKDVHVCKVVKLDDGSYNYEVVKTYEDVLPTGLKVG